MANRTRSTGAARNFPAPSTTHTTEIRISRLLMSIQEARLTAGLTQEALGYELGRSQAWVNNQETSERPDCEPCILALDRICTATDSVAPIRELARTHAHILVKIAVDIPLSREVADQLARTAHEHADVISASVKALADGTLTPAEYERIHQEITEAQESLAALDSLLKAKANPTRTRKGVAR